jgi:hypothetical protein
MCKDGTNPVEIVNEEISIGDFAIDDTRVYYHMNGDIYAVSK